MKKEIWKDVVGFEGFYKVSNTGRIRRLKRTFYSGKDYKIKQTYNERDLKLHYNKDGYLRCSLTKNSKTLNKFVHRLVLEAFNGIDNTKKLTNHKNGIKDDNRLENLEWVTDRENKLHAFKIGLMFNGGERSSFHKLKENQVIEIKKLLKKGISRSIVANQFNVCYETIMHIDNGSTWGHI